AHVCVCECVHGCVCVCVCVCVLVNTVHSWECVCVCVCWLGGGCVLHVAFCPVLPLASVVLPVVDLSVTSRDLSVTSCESLCALLPMRPPREYRERCVNKLSGHLAFLTP